VSRADVVLVWAVCASILAGWGWGTAWALAKFVARESARSLEQSEALARIYTTGSPAAVEAVVTPGEPDAEQRLASRISEDTIQRGMAHLRVIYGNTPVEDEVLRAEAESMLNGLEPRIPPGLPLGLPRD
jgi:hypothetical protein